MELEKITASAHPRGNRIILSWLNPEPESYRLVRIVRRKDSHPLTPEPLHEWEGRLVGDFPNNAVDLLTAGIDAQCALLDNKDLRASLAGPVADRGGIILSPDARVEIAERSKKWRIVDGAEIFIVYLTPGKLWFHKTQKIVDSGLDGEKVYYYTFFPQNAGDEFVFFPRNRASAATSSRYDFGRLLYEHLPRIYHRYDTLLPEGDNNGQLTAEDLKHGQLRRFLDVPGGELDLIYSYTKFLANVYDVEKTEGKALRLLSQWIGWNASSALEISEQRNEIKYAPHLYSRVGLIPQIEATVMRVAGWKCRCKEFVHNVFLANNPERLNLWAAVKAQGGEWRFSDKPLSLDFSYEGAPGFAKTDEAAGVLFYHTLRSGRWQVWKKELKGAGENEIEWRPSECVAWGKHDCRHPQALYWPAQEKVFLFYDVYDRDLKTWRIEAGRFTGGLFEKSGLFLEPGTVERKNPIPCLDQSGGLWLFWKEKTAGGWTIKYDTLVWADGFSFSDAGPKTFRPGGIDLAIAEEMCVAFYSKDAQRRILVFWAQKEFIENEGKNLFRIAYAWKPDQDIANENWAAVNLVPDSEPTADWHMREPFLSVREDGVVLFFSSNRKGPWSVFSQRLGGEVSALPSGWQGAERITFGQYSDKAPIAFPLGTSLHLLYRSSRTLFYESETYRATTTADQRYSGSLTAEARNGDKLDEMKKYDDCLSYSYAPGHENDDPKTLRNYWHARNVVGVYVTPNTSDELEIKEKIAALYNNLSEFLPATDRAVIIEERDENEYVYDYEKRLSGGGRRVEETYSDSLVSSEAETVIGPADGYQDER